MATARAASKFVAVMVNVLENSSLEPSIAASSSTGMSGNFAATSAATTGPVRNLSWVLM